MKKFQLVSDIHLEFHGKWINYATLLPCIGDYIILCGDIGRPSMETRGIRHYKEFLEYCSRHWERVFLITGNHEYYGWKRPEIEKTIRTYCQPYNNVHFLQDSAYYFTPEDDVPYYGIYGTTLWTNVDDASFSKMNDSRIRSSNSMAKNTYQKKLKYINGGNVREWHQQHLELLRTTLKQSRTSHRKWIIITHHAPKPELGGDDSHSDDLDCAYVNNLDSDVFDKKQIAVWCSGHLHTHRDIVLDGIRCISNCMGYPGEVTGYKPTTF